VITINVVHKYGADEAKTNNIAINAIQQGSYQSKQDQDDELALANMSSELKEDVTPLINQLNNLPANVLFQLLSGKSGFEEVLSLTDVQSSLMNTTENNIKAKSLSELQNYANQLQLFRKNVLNGGNSDKLLQSLIGQVSDKISSLKEEEAKQEQAKLEADKKQQEQQKLQALKQVKNSSSTNSSDSSDNTVLSNLAPSSSLTKSSTEGVSVPTHNYSSGNTYAWGNCTWGVKAYFGNRVGDYWGNGEDWANSARNAGFTVDGNPVAWNTVAVFSGGLYGSSTQYGHVAIVSDVKGDEVEVYEMNIAGLGAYSYRWLPKAGLQFIHV
jgi:surface antigen